MNKCIHGNGPDCLKCAADCAEYDECDYLRTENAALRKEVEGLRWTTDWFKEKGLYLISGSSLGIMLVDYLGGDLWFVSGKQRIGANADTKENWIETRDIMCDPIYRTVKPITEPHWQPARGKG
jgi:hypothetical protein